MKFIKDEFLIKIILLIIILILWNMLIGPKYNEPHYLRTSFQPVLMSGEVIRTVNSIRNFGKFDVSTIHSESYFEVLKTRKQLIDFHLKDTTKQTEPVSINTRTPAYPLFVLLVSSVQVIPKVSIQSVLLIQRFLDTLILVIIFLYIVINKRDPALGVILIILFTLLFYKKFFLAAEQSLLFVDSSLTGFLVISVIILYILSWQPQKNFLSYIFALLTGILYFIRNEYFPVLFLLVITLSYKKYFIEKSGINKTVLIMIVFLVLPLLWGTRNYFDTGRFEFIRSQGGQNLYEPIGQFENKSGIKYSDVWIDSLLNSKGMKQGSREADSYFMDEYFRILKTTPEILISNFKARMDIILKSHIPGEYYFLIFFTMYLLLIFFKYIKKEEYIPVLLLSVFIFLFYSWTHYLGRFVYPLTYIAMFIMLRVIYELYSLILKKFSNVGSLIPPQQ